MVAAAGALQLVDSIVPSTRLPDWSDELFLALLILGFPIALVLAWAFEAGPEGIRRTPPDSEVGTAPGEAGGGTGGEGRREAASPDAPPPASSRTVTGDGPADLVEASRREEDAARELDPRRIAVLPFDFLTGTEEGEPLGVGLHDDLLTELARIPGLTVISRTSVKAYRATDKPVRQIALELGVGTLVECGIQSAGERVRLNVQLIDARHDAHRWAETFDRALSVENLFDIQSELARKIAGSLRAELTEEEGRRLVSRRATEDLDAYRLCARGRERLDRRTEDEMRRAVDLFRDAIERDAGYVLAWVGLADALGLLVSYGHDDPGHGLPRAEEAAGRALELDPESAEAHASLGLLGYLRRRGPEALRLFERAIELRSGYAEAHNWLAYVRLLLGRRAAALESARRAVELDPLSAEAVSNLSLASLVTGRADDAVREARRVRALEPSWTSGPFCEALACYELGRFDDAISLLRDLSVPWAGAGAPASLALAHAASGELAAAEHILERMDADDDAFASGLVRAALGDRGGAFEAFGRVGEWGDWPSMAIHGLYTDVWNRLRDDPRYPEILTAADRSWGVEPARPG